MRERDRHVGPRVIMDAKETIAPGVDVGMLNFSVNNAKPPFHAACFEVLPGCKTPLDQHSVEECWVILEGSGLLVHEGVTYVASKSATYYFASLEQHLLINNHDEILQVLSIYW